MKLERDYVCEVMGLVVIAVLSALSHFWYVLIAIGILGGMAGVGLLIATVLLRLGRQVLARVLNPVHHEDSLRQAVLSVDAGPGPSLPITYLATHPSRASLRLADSDTLGDETVRVR